MEHEKDEEEEKTHLSVITASLFFLVSQQQQQNPRAMENTRTQDKGVKQRTEAFAEQLNLQRICICASNRRCYSEMQPCKTFKLNSHK